MAAVNCKYEDVFVILQSNCKASPLHQYFMRHIAVILAGGTGSRLGGTLPKQFLKAGGRMVIEHTLEAFEKCEAVDEICVVAHKDHLSIVDREELRSRFPKLRHVIPGGRERHDSSIAAIRHFTDCGEGDDSVLLFHDAARPLVSGRILADCIAAMATHDAAAVGIPSTDTIWVVDDDDKITAVPPRARLRNAQTPQCFRLATIREAYRRALEDPGFHATDDCGVVSAYMPHCSIHVVEGDRLNFKITYPDDLRQLESLTAGRRAE